MVFDSPLCSTSSFTACPAPSHRRCGQDRENPSPRAVDRSDDVTRLDAGLGGRAVGLRLSTMRALACFRPRLSAISARDRLHLHAEPASRDIALVLELVDDELRVAAGMSKPMPTEPPDGEKIAVFTPITLPFMSNAGPPELPLLIGASIWM